MTSMFFKILAFWSVCSSAFVVQDSAGKGTEQHPFVPFLLKNVDSATGLPHSYYVPDGYFESVPADERPTSAKESAVVLQCDGQMVRGVKKLLCLCITKTIPYFIRLALIS